jgi:Phosphopantothenoylcysteine synthetase/decarboxylase
MKVLITSGGTTERIDAVRSITNTSTGSLGSLIADCFATYGNIERITYICSKSAVKPKSEKINRVVVDTVASLENAVKRLLSETDVDIIIHSMAVSDYRVKAVTSCDRLADQILLQKEQLDFTTSQKVHDFSAQLLQNSQSVINGERKISSDVENMILIMERTPKIISLFQSLSPQATLVGFKLLDNVSLETLINRGYQVLKDNNCSFVLANDFCEITENQHIGYLIDKSKNFSCHQTKQEIANAIVSATLKEREMI